MRKVLLIARRDYIASVRTKAFSISLLLAPLLFGGSFFATIFVKGAPREQVRRIVIVDNTAVATAAIIKQVAEKDLRDGREKNTGIRVLPKYELERVAPDTKDPAAQLLALSDRVRRNDLFAFMEVGPGNVKWYSNEGGFGEAERWFSGPVNDGLRRVRLTMLGLHDQQLDQALKQVPLESMNLLARDVRTGRIVAARKRGVGEGFAAPFILAVLFFMIVLLASTPMLAGVAEDKTQRVFEMLLASATPLELINGKVLAAIGTALTSSVFYVAGALFLLEALAMIGQAPLRIIPWFFVYLIAEVIVLSSLATALGAACSSTRDTENLKLIVIAPVMIPLLVLTPVLAEPNGTFATSMSLFPLFTPLLMLIRQAAPGGVPAWQAWLGISGVLVTTIAISWMASRIFRVAILFQGKMPGACELWRWGFKG